MRLRPATPDDAEVVCALILELADYERAQPGDAVTTPEAVRAHLDPAAAPRLFGILAETDEGEPVGVALFFPVYSTWRANWGVYLEDLFVRPAYRSQGYGFALLQAVAAEAVRRGAHRLDWMVLNWNRLAIDFYERLGAKPMGDWTVMRLEGEALRKLGEG
ncbi:MAG TPA: GNAT family N-acetyltransferase [Rubricoccaceae bacterium]|nr:GNAT family N-acetyltransferase [Rubricoccaceae bacterium]